MAISGKTTGSGLFEMMEVMGKEKVIERMEKASINTRRIWKTKNLQIHTGYSRRA